MDLDQRFPAVSDLRARAKRRVPHFVFEYLDSATGVEDQHRRNMEALRAVRFHPAILEGPMPVDLSTTFLGRTYPLPFGCAPVGMSGIMWPGAEKILSAACAECGHSLLHVDRGDGGARDARAPHRRSGVVPALHAEGPRHPARHDGPGEGRGVPHADPDGGRARGQPAGAAAAGEPAHSAEGGCGDAVVHAPASGMDGGHAARGHPEPQVLRGLRGPEDRVQLGRPCGARDPGAARLGRRGRDPGGVGRAFRREGRDAARGREASRRGRGRCDLGVEPHRAAVRRGPCLARGAAADAGGAAGHAHHLRQRGDRAVSTSCGRSRWGRTS